MSVEDDPLVTVGMTTYHQPEKLKKALDCIVNQTYKNLEIIISEDCSPCEATLMLLQQYEERDSRIKVIHQKVNLGPPTNINFVLTQATGKYFMWADDDDIRDLEWVEKLLGLLLNNSSAIVSVGKIVTIDENEKPVLYHPTLAFSGPRTLRLAKNFLAEESDGKACVVCGLFNTDFLKSIKPWGEYNKKYFGVDFLFVIDCLQHGEVVVDNSVTLYKRMPVGARAEKSKRTVGLLINRIQYFVNCSFIPSSWLDKSALLILVPIKTLKFSFNILLRSLIKS